ncbi:hypothetical protein [Polaribacter sp. Hel_I_88]|uniref:hypothetical protein n=1 Tax=Polaribacter sp. Hel_I_88 TaxID=1250006 RepID=UPI00047E6A5A|nr:hypothetical protein [Polaribacter sp. Hel_I_88]
MQEDNTTNIEISTHLLKVVTTVISGLLITFITAILTLFIQFKLYSQKQDVIQLSLEKLETRILDYTAVERFTIKDFVNNNSKDNLRITKLEFQVEQILKDKK